MAVKIGFAGDFCPQGRIEKLYLEDKWRSLFEQTNDLFARNDLNIIDLECPLIEDGEPILKTGPHLKCLPDTADILNYLGVDLVATANNHFLDYGQDGLKSTYDALRSRDIDWVGSGMNIEEASQTYFKEIKDLTFAIINIAENEWSTTHGSDPGVNPLDAVGVYNQIQDAKKNAEFVIIISHGGNEHYNLPSPRIKGLFRFFINSGACAVISHHTHTISGYEVYHQCPIFYGLGNFCFDWPGLTNKPWNYGLVVNLELDVGKPVQFTYNFTLQNDENPGISVLLDKELAKMEYSIQQLNRIIQDNEQLQSAFNTYCEGLRDVYNTWLEPYTSKYLSSLSKHGFLPSLLGKRKKRLYTNIIRCESHRDVLLTILQDKDRE